MSFARVTRGTNKDKDKNMRETVINLANPDQVSVAFEAAEKTFRDDVTQEEAALAICLPWMEVYAIPAGTWRAVFSTADTVHKVLDKSFGRMLPQPLGQAPDFKDFIRRVRLPKIDKEVPNMTHQWIIPDNSGVLLEYEMFMSPEGFGRSVSWLLKRALPQGVING